MLLTPLKALRSGPFCSMHPVPYINAWQIFLPATGVLLVPALLVSLCLFLSAGLKCRSMRTSFSVSMRHLPLCTFFLVKPA